MVKLSYLIVNYNALNLLIKFLSTLQPSLSSSEYEVIIFDNGSMDGSREYFTDLSQKQQNLKYVYSYSNVGFGQGMNKASEIAQGETLVIINPDIEFPRGGFDQFILKHIDQNVLFSPQIIDIQTGQILPNAGGFSSFFAYLLQLFKLGSLVRKLGLINLIKHISSHFPLIEKTIIGKYLKNFEDQKKDLINSKTGTASYLESDWISGACLVIDSQFFKKLKGFDDQIFIYCEDEDLCRRARDKGATCRVYSDFQIGHWVGATMGDELSALSKGRRERFKSNLYYLKKWQGDFTSNSLKVIYIIYFALAALVWSIRLNFKLAKDRLAFAFELSTYKIPRVQLH